MTDYRGKRVVVVGLGLSGYSCIDFFLARGVIPKVMDTRQSLADLQRLPDQVERCLGVLNQQWLLDADLIVVSPGVALATPELQQAAEVGVEIIGDIELFCREVQGPIIAITGSNGKSTVTTLVGEMAKAAGWAVGVGGNIGVPVLNLLQAPSQLYVLELSSFQLETTHSLRALAATVLNVTEDHMNRYPQGIGEYQAAKLKVYHGASNCIINADDPLTEPAKSETGQRKIRFGVDSGEYHLYQEQQDLWLCAQGENLLNIRQMKLVGRHNYTNALAALALADVAGIPREGSLRALQEFAGLAHRCQLVWQHNGVRWVNDSKATNVGSTEAALNGLHTEGVLHLLLGGDGKSADFSPLRPYLSGDRVRLYCFGRDGARLAALRQEIAIQTETMQQAIQQVVTQLQPGDMVLLSPACASLDQFTNFEQRGREFTRLAQELG